MFKPMLAPNQQPELSELNYPLYASTKLDGIRCIFYKGEILSRSLKQIQCKQLREKFEPLRKYSEDNNVILDGEIYGVGMTFQEITHFVMTKDLEDSKTVKKNGGVTEIPEGLKFFCFDAVKDDNFEQPFQQRIAECSVIENIFPKIVKYVEQETVLRHEQVTEYFEEVLEDGYEGLILKSINGRYKCGRGTLNESLIFKVKPFRTFDAKILDVEQATVVDPEAEKKTNELGRSVTSKKKNDRILIEKASAFTVKYCTECNGTEKAINGDEECTCPFCKTLKVVIAMTDEQKEEIWKNREFYIGRMIEYKGMIIGSKNVPRHPVMTRFRSDKDAS